MKDKVVIMGAGIQGICCALALSNLGIQVTLIDKTPEPMLRASLRNEGKIHLGFIYANDNSFRTASLMLRSALNFSPMIESFVGRSFDWTPLRSRKFNYLILRDTMLSTERILAHYQFLQQEYERIREPEMHYLGNRPELLWTNKHLQIPQLNQEMIKMCVPTEELAINLEALRALLLAEMRGRDNITFLGDHCIEEVKKTSYGYSLTGRKTEGTKWMIETDRLINCLWENRLYFDRQLGIEPGRKWVYRLKHRILGIPNAAIAALDSFTCVLGAFGDIVNYDDHLTYLSWYPECMTGWSSELTTPESWEAACNGMIPENDKKEWVNKALKGLNSIFPGIVDFDVRRLDGGIIFSWGRTDIDDIKSELHNRFDIGIHHSDGYYSIDTGKLTSAPYFANNLQKLFV
jgi:glycine/D-amino acid oxidase-like deaminating enzyme